MKNHDIPGIINGKKHMNNQQTPIPDSHLEAIHLWISSAWSPTASSTVARWRSRDIGSRAPRKTPWWPAAPRTWEVKAWVKRTGWSMKNGDLFEFTEIYRDLRWIFFINYLYFLGAVGIMNGYSHGNNFHKSRYNPYNYGYLYHHLWLELPPQLMSYVVNEHSYGNHHV